MRPRAKSRPHADHTPDLTRTEPFPPAITPNLASLAKLRCGGRGEGRGSYLGGELRAEALAEEDGVAVHEEAQAAVDMVHH